MPEREQACRKNSTMNSSIALRELWKILQSRDKLPILYIQSQIHSIQHQAKMLRATDVNLPLKDLAWYDWRDSI